MITDKSVIGSTLGVCSVEYQPTAHHGSRTTTRGPGARFDGWMGETVGRCARISGRGLWGWGLGPGLAERLP